MLFCFRKLNFHAEREENTAAEMASPSGGGQTAESSPSGCCHSPCLLQDERVCVRAARYVAKSSPSVCCHSPCLRHAEHAAVTPTSARAARSDFAKLSTASLFSNPHLTNHESLPPLLEAFSDFTVAFPQYRETQRADLIRQGEYGHLAGHVCLDYSGVNLFSHAQMNPLEASPPPRQPPFFRISFKSTSLKSEIRHGEEGRGFEFSVRHRIMSFLKVSGNEYGMVCATNRTAAFRLLGETYPFHSAKKLLTVYDHESEAVSAIAESAEKRGAKVISSSFCWPGLRIQSTNLKNLLSRKKTKKKRGLFVFPHISRMSGVRYPYLWLKFARENGWHVALDASSSGQKDMDSLGVRFIQPDFIICSFFKVFGENPAGFAGLFIKKSSLEFLQTSIIARSIGIVSIVPAHKFSDMASEEEEEELSSEIVEVEIESNKEDQLEIEFKGLDHADSLGLTLIHNRLRCLTNWLVIALTKLRHPHSKNGDSLVKIYGPQVKFDRGPVIAFNVFDWKGEKINPLLVQKLADRSSISLSCGFLQNIIFSEKYEQFKDEVLEKRVDGTKASGSDKKENQTMGISVVNASLGYLANFEDAYQLWGFVAKFLDADFVEKERWRYVALNQRLIEL